MPIVAAQIVLVIAGLYAAFGVLVGIPFVGRGVSRVDPGARGAPVAFRLIILPGIVALWPLVVRWWMRAGRSGAPEATRP